MIRMYEGRLRQGKSLMMIHDALPYIYKYPEKIITNQPLYIHKRGKHVKTIEPVTGEQLKHEFYYGVEKLFLLDEANVLFPSYKLTALTETEAAVLAYKGKYGCAILYTSQSFVHTHKRLRDITDEICKVTKLKNPFIKHRAVYYDPAFYDVKRQLTDEQERAFIIKKKDLWFNQVNEPRKSYDTQWVSMTSIIGQGVAINLKQPKELGAREGLYRNL